MKLSLQSDLALRLLMALAANPDRLCTIAEVADFYGVSKNHLMKVAQTLASEGVVESVRGRAGGLRLARAPEHIHIGDVVGRTEEFALLGCMGVDARTATEFCHVSPACRLKGVFGEAMLAFKSVLDRYTLADLVKGRSAALLKMPA